MLDSNVLSELRSAKRCDPRVRAWQEEIPAASCFISVISLMEIRRGIEMVRRTDKPFSEALDRWLEDQIRTGFASRCLPVGPPVAERAGQIAAGRTRGLADCLIAATAIDHRLVLATRNVGDFEDIGGLRLVNPWDG